MDIYNLNCIAPFLSIVSENEYLQDYIFTANPPNYQYSKYIDWLMPYLLRL